MDISQFRYYLELCRIGNISRAAKELNISPQGLSVAISRMEEEFGVALFYRHSKGLTVTETGEAIRKEADAIVGHLNRIYEIAEQKNAEKYKIKVGITSGRFQSFAPELQNLLLTPPEEYNVICHNDFSRICAEKVLDNEYNYAMVYGSYDESKYRVDLLENVKEVFVVNKANPLAQRETLSIQELNSLPVVMAGLKTVPGITIYNELKKLNVKIDIVLEEPVPHQPIDIARNNKKVISLTPESYITEQDLEYVKILPIHDFDLSIPYVLLSSKLRKADVHEKLFRHLILDSYQ